MMIMTMMIKMIIAVTQSILKVRTSRFRTELDLENDDDNNNNDCEDYDNDHFLMLDLQILHGSRSR